MTPTIADKLADWGIPDSTSGDFWHGRCIYWYAKLEGLGREPSAERDIASDGYDLAREQFGRITGTEFDEEAEAERARATARAA